MTDSIKTINDYVNRAKKAQAQINHYTQEQIDMVCVAIGWEVYNDENISLLAKSAVSETGMGNVSDKILKHKNKVLGVLKDVKDAKSVGLIETDDIKKIDVLSLEIRCLLKEESMDADRIFNLMDKIYLIICGEHLKILNNS